MAKTLTRAVAFLLVPLIAADPSSASVLASFQHVSHFSSAHQRSLVEAITPELLVSERNLMGQRRLGLVGGTLGHRSDALRIAHSLPRDSTDVPIGWHSVLPKRFTAPVPSTSLATRHVSKSYSELIQEVHDFNEPLSIISTQLGAMLDTGKFTVGRSGLEKARAQVDNVRDRVVAARRSIGPGSDAESVEAAIFEMVRAMPDLEALTKTIDASFPPYFQNGNADRLPLLKSAAAMALMKLRGLQEPKQPFLLDINSSIRHAIHTHNREGIELTFVPKSELPLVYADPGDLYSLMANFIENAQDAIVKAHGRYHPGGKIRISTEQDFGRRGVKVIVQDNGIGISDDIAPHIFEPGFSTKETSDSKPDRGQGLPSADRLVQKIGGAIERTFPSDGDYVTEFDVHVPSVILQASNALNRASIAFYGFRRDGDPDAMARISERLGRDIQKTGSFLQPTANVGLQMSDLQAAAQVVHATLSFIAPRVRLIQDDKRRLSLMRIQSLLGYVEAILTSDQAIEQPIIGSVPPPARDMPEPASTKPLPAAAPQPVHNPDSQQLYFINHADFSDFAAARIPFPWAVWIVKFRGDHGFPTTRVVKSSLRSIKPSDHEWYTAEGFEKKYEKVWSPIRERGYPIRGQQGHQKMFDWIIAINDSFGKKRVLWTDPEAPVAFDKTLRSAAIHLRSLEPSRRSWFDLNQNVHGLQTSFPFNKFFEYVENQVSNGITAPTGPRRDLKPPRAAARPMNPPADPNFGRARFFFPSKNLSIWIGAFLAFLMTITISVRSAAQNVTTLWPSSTSVAAPPRFERPRTERRLRPAA